MSARWCCSLISGRRFHAGVRAVSLALLAASPRSPADIPAHDIDAAKLCSPAFESTCRRAVAAALVIP
jgi:hypothetical protein